MRLVHVHFDGSLALVPDEDCEALPALAAPASDPAAVSPTSIPSRPATGDAAPVDPAPSLKPRALPLGRLFKAWVPVLLATTEVTFCANTKTGKSAQRFALYCGAKTVGDYRLANNQAAFVHEDLAFDLSRSLARLPPAGWSQLV